MSEQKHAGCVRLFCKHSTDRCWNPLISSAALACIKALSSPTITVKAFPFVLSFFPLLFCFLCVEVSPVTLLPSPQECKKVSCHVNDLFCMCKKDMISISGGRGNQASVCRKRSVWGLRTVTIDQMGDAGHTPAGLRSSALSHADRQSCYCHLQISVFHSLNSFLHVWFFCANIYMQMFQRNFITAPRAMYKIGFKT